MFWKKKESTKKPKSARSAASADGDDDYSLAQFGIKPVSDKDVEADLAKLMQDMKRETGIDDIDYDDSSDEEAKIMRQLQEIGVHPGGMSSFDGEVDSDGFADDISDSDMNDPHLQAELNEITGAQGSNISSQIDERARLEILIQDEKQCALRLKSEGRIPEALDAMRTMKTYQAELNNIPIQSITPPPPKEIHREQRALSIDDTSIDVTDEDMNNPEYDAILSNQTTASSNSIAERIEALKKEVVMTKQLAVQMKRNNNIAEALEALRKAKQLEISIQELESQSANDTTPESSQVQEANTILHSLPDPSTVAIAYENSAADEEVEVTDEDMADPAFDEELKKLHSVTENPRSHPFETRNSSHLIDEFDDEEYHESISDEVPATPPSLEEQIQLAKTMAITFKRGGDIQAALVQLRIVKELELQLNPNILEQQRLAAFESIESQLVEFGNKCTEEAKALLSVNRERSLIKLNQRKEYEAALKVLRVAKTNPLQQPPLVKIDEMVEIVEHTNLDVPIDRIELTIVQLRSTSSEPRDLFVKVGLNVPSQNPHELTTPSVRGGAAFEYNTASSFPIQRSRGLQKLCELRKASIEVFTAGGFWSKSESVGKASLPLSPLLKRSEIHCWLPMMVSRRPCGIDVQIRIRLNIPLQEKELREVRSPVLVVGEYPPIRIIEQPIVPMPNQVVEARSQVSLDLQSSEDEDPLSVESIVSYDIICQEIERITKKLEEGKNEVLSDRLDTLKLKKQILEIDMESGKLTLDMYLDQLKGRIVHDNTLARKLFKNGRKLEAAEVLRRTKVMQQEIDSASQATG